MVQTLAAPFPFLPKDRATRTMAKNASLFGFKTSAESLAAEPTPPLRMSLAPRFLALMLKPILSPGVPAGISL